MEKFEPIGDPQSSWWNFQAKLIDHIKKSDIKKFLRWDVIRHTMFCIPPKVEYKSVLHSALIEDFPDLILENKAGLPPFYFKNTKSSGNLIHHLYSINQLRNSIGKIKFDQIKSVVEFGGGYGSLARIFFKMQMVENYFIFDLPVFGFLQKKFLVQVFDEENFDYTQEQSSLKVNYKKDKTSEIFFENSYDNKLNECDLFVAMWSMSESPLSVRTDFEESINKSKFSFIAFQKEFDNIDNVQYFRNLLTKYKILNYSLTEIKHLSNNYYLIIDNSCKK